MPILLVLGLKSTGGRPKKHTREVRPAKNNANDYRGLRQPITVPPVASFDGSDTNFLHVIFGAGKFEDIADSAGINDDKSDLARTSIYNLKDLVQPPKSDFFSANAQTLVAGSANFKIEVNPRCPSSHTIRNWPKSGDDAVCLGEGRRYQGLR